MNKFTFIHIQTEQKKLFDKNTHSYLVGSYNGSTDIKWWNTEKADEKAATIDFTIPAAAEWYVNRLKKLQKEAGIDGYKFDGGEAFTLPTVNNLLHNECALCCSLE